MAAVTVSADNLRVADMETSVGIISAYGAGPAGSTDADFFYQGHASFSRKVTAGGVGWSTTPFNASTNRRNTIMVKILATNSGVLGPKGTSGYNIRMGESSNTFWEFFVEGVDTYPIKGGWLVRPIDPNVVAYIDSSNGTTANLDPNSIDFLHIFASFTAGSKDVNVMLDAIDVGAGLNLVGGDGVSADGTFQDFVDADEGSTASRFGYVATNEGVVQVFGMLWIGQSTAQLGVATEFLDADEVVLFPDAEFGAGFSGISIDLTTLSTVTMNGITFLGRGTTATEDTRPVFTITGTSGHILTSGCAFDAFSTITMTTASTMVGAKFTNTLSIIQGGGFLTDCNMSAAANSTGGDALVDSTDLSRISSCEFTVSSGHAIRAVAPDVLSTQTFSFDGNNFTGYGADGTSNAALLNNTSRALQINVSGGTGLTFRNANSSNLTTITNTVTLTAIVVDEGGSSISGAQVWISTVGSTIAILNEDTATTGAASTSFNFLTTESITVRVRKASSGATAFLPFVGPGEITSAGFTQTVRLTVDNTWTSLA